jgi:hypothetical protein
MYFCKKIRSNICIYYAINNFYQNDIISIEEYINYFKKNEKASFLINYLYNYDKTLCLLIKKPFIFEVFKLYGVHHYDLIDFLKQKIPKIFIIEKTHIVVILNKKNNWYLLDSQNEIKQKITKKNFFIKLFNADFILLPFNNNDFFQKLKVKINNKIKSYPKFYQEYFTELLETLNTYIEF